MTACEDDKGHITDDELAELEALLADYVCGDCDYNTHLGQEYYVVQDHIWELHGNGDGLLCIGCLERRLGRQLTAADFKDISLNNGKYREKFGASPRLADRLAAELESS